jgi:hypothetical protein
MGGTSGAQIGGGAAATARTYLIHQYAKKNSAEGGTDQQKLERGYIIDAWSDLIGSLSNWSGSQESQKTATQSNQTPGSFSWKAAGMNLGKQIGSGFANLFLGVLSPLTGLANLAKTAGNILNPLGQIKEADGVGLVGGNQIASRDVFESPVLSVPVGSRYDIIGSGNGPVEIAGQTYTKGTFVFDGQTWNLEGEGQVLANDYDGFSMKNGQKIPVNVIAEEIGLTPLGISWNELEGQELISNKSVELIGVGTLYAGGVRGGRGRASVFGGKPLSENWEQQSRVYYGTRRKSFRATGANEWGPVYS